MNRSGHPQKILIFHSGALGDLVNTLPAICCLKEKFPKAQVTAVGNLTFLAALKTAGMIDHAISFDSCGFHSLFIDAPLPEKMRLFLEGFDLTVSWVRDPCLIKNIQKADSVVIGLREQFPPAIGSPHITEIMARPLTEAGIFPSSFFPRLKIPDSDQEQCLKFSGILVHPGSGSPKKNWSPQRFAGVIRNLMRHVEKDIAILEGPADMENAAKVIQELGDIQTLRYQNLSLVELIHLLDGSAMVLGNDSGVCHLAGAVGTPVVAIFGPTDPAVWGVRQPHAVNVVSGVSCSPCTHKEMWRCETRECLGSITETQVVEACLKLIGTGSEKRPA